MYGSVFVALAAALSNPLLADQTPDRLRDLFEPRMDTDRHG
jgi:hypothetical protein